jgi:hypothetical protein
MELWQNYDSSAQRWRGRALAFKDKNIANDFYRSSQAKESLT